MKLQLKISLCWQYLAQGNNLFGYPVSGSSWEGLAIESIINKSNRMNAYFYQTSNGEEIDLILTSNQKKVNHKSAASIISAPKELTTTIKTTAISREEVFQNSGSYFRRLETI